MKHIEEMSSKQPILYNRGYYRSNEILHMSRNIQYYKVILHIFVLNYKILCNLYPAVTWYEETSL